MKKIKIISLILTIVLLSNIVYGECLTKEGEIKLYKNIIKKAIPSITDQNLNKKAEILSNIFSSNNKITPISNKITPISNKISDNPDSTKLKIKALYLLKKENPNFNKLTNQEKNIQTEKIAQKIFESEKNRIKKDLEQGIINNDKAFAYINFETKDLINLQTKSSEIINNIYGPNTFAEILQLKIKDEEIMELTAKIYKPSDYTSTQGWTKNNKIWEKTVIINPKTYEITKPKTKLELALIEVKKTINKDWSKEFEWFNTENPKSNKNAELLFKIIDERYEELYSSPAYFGSGNEKVVFDPSKDKQLSNLIKGNVLISKLKPNLDSRDFRDYKKVHDYLYNKYPKIVAKIYAANKDTMIIEKIQGKTLNKWLLDKTDIEKNEMKLKLFNMIRNLIKENINLATDFGKDNIIIRPDGTPTLIDIGAMSKINNKYKAISDYTKRVQSQIYGVAETTN